MPSQQTIRRVVMTGGVTAITVFGTIYGAGLKMRQEGPKQAARPQTVSLSPEEQIEHLEAARAKLIHKKLEMERKIEDFKARRKAETEGANP